jgi:hypothetical protein
VSSTRGANEQNLEDGSLSGNACVILRNTPAKTGFVGFQLDKPRTQRRAARGLPGGQR